MNKKSSRESESSTNTPKTHDKGKAKMKSQDKIDNFTITDSNYTDTIIKIRVATINVQGINEGFKKRLIFEELSRREIDIVAVTETKLAEKEDLRTQLINEWYKVYIAATTEDKEVKREASMGVALLVKPDINCYIHDIQTYKGTAIYIDFFFPRNNRTRVIAVYIPTGKIELIKQTQVKVKEWIESAKARTMNTLVMGDFNSNTERKEDIRKMFIFKSMQENQLMSILNEYKIKEYTWKRGELESQIDDIWMSLALITTTTYPMIEEVISTNSDHRMVITEIEVKELKRKRRKKQKRKIFLYKETEEEEWVNFGKEVKDKIEKLEIKSITNEETLNKAWHK